MTKFLSSSGIFPQHRKVNLLYSLPFWKNMFLNIFLKFWKVIHIMRMHGGVFQKIVYKFSFSLLAGITFFATINSV